MDQELLQATQGSRAQIPPEYRGPQHRVGDAPWKHWLLFGLTGLNVMTAMGLPYTRYDVDWLANLVLMATFGGPYALTLMLILFAHEMGHYLAARRHGVLVSLPYFLPGPPLLSFGTFGAFIRMQDRVHDRRALIDIGMAGPLAGMVLTVPALILGLHLSRVVPLAELQGGLFEGNSLIYLFLKWWVLGPIPAGYDVTLHPIAFAGWMGLLVTSLNLLPIGQLDGGHITHALFGGRWAHRVARLLYWGMIALAAGVALFTQQFVWVLWIVLISLIGIRHPPMGNEAVRLDPGRRVLGWFALLLFVLTFTPIPLSDTPAGGWPQDRPIVEEDHAVLQVSGMRGADSGVVSGAGDGGR